MAKLLKLSHKQRQAILGILKKMRAVIEGPLYPITEKQMSDEAVVNGDLSDNTGQPNPGIGMPSDTPIVPRHLVNQWRETQSAKGAYFEANDEAKKLKKSWEAKQEEFDKAMASTLEECPMFDSTTGESDEVEDGCNHPPQAKDQTQEDLSWRDTLLSTLFLGLPHGIIEKCHASSIQTLGQLSDFINDNHVLTDIPGVGAVKAEMIEHALEIFWRRRNASSPAAIGVTNEEQPQEEQANGTGQ